ncbi:MAG: BspA family leucine-rich repeat surface protein, partial [Salinispira sp.]
IGTSTHHTITSLTNGTEYDVQVRARNTQGNSAWSAAQTATLPLIGTRVPVGTAAFVILSEDVHNLIASENLIVKLTTVEPNTAVLSPQGAIWDVIPATDPAGVTVPTVNASTGIITVTASTTAGTYLVYGEKTDGTLWFAHYFYVIVNPQTNAELKTAVTTGITIWGNTANLNYIITTAITDMSKVFKDKSAFNGDISGWDTSRVTNMSYMFLQTRTFNGDISNWDVSSVRNMTGMFYQANAFNRDISSWNVSSVTSVEMMFFYASTFNGDISGWNVSSVTNMQGMFAQASAFNRDLEEWKDHWTLSGGTYTGTKNGMFSYSGVPSSLIPSWY